MLSILIQCCFVSYQDYSATWKFIYHSIPYVKLESQLTIGICLQSFGSDFLYMLIEPIAKETTWKKY